MHYLSTNRMKLVEFTQQDCSLIRDLDSDPEVMKYLTDGKPSDETEVNRAIGVFLDYTKKYHHKFGYWKALDQKTDEFIGWFHFRPLKSELNNLEKIELGYRLRKKYWGKGLATEGSLALIEKGFDELNVKEVWALTMKANKASQRVMEKAGLSFSHEDKFLDFPGEDKTCVWYALKLTDYLS